MELPLKRNQKSSTTPACSPDRRVRRLLAWFGADVLKGRGACTPEDNNPESSWRDIPNADAPLLPPWSTSNKRSLENQHQDARRQGDPGGADPPLRR